MPGIPASQDHAVRCRADGVLDETWRYPDNAGLSIHPGTAAFETIQRRRVLNKDTGGIQYVQGAEMDLFQLVLGEDLEVQPAAGRLACMCLSFHRQFVLGYG